MAGPRSLGEPAIYSTGSSRPRSHAPSMSMTKDQLLAEAMSLAADDRESLAQQLLLSLTGEEQAALDAAWLAEVRRRDDAFARGETGAAPVDEVVGRIRSRARQ